MSNSTIDPRIIPLVRSLKEQSIKPTKNNIQDISSEKTSENSAKFKENQKIEEEKDFNNKKEDKPRKSKGNIRLREKSNTIVKKKLSTKISIDGSVDNKLIKTGTAENHRHQANSSNKIKIISKNKEQKFNFTNAFQSPSNLINKKDKDNYNYNKIKTRTKYVQNLLSDMSIKKYKQSCIDLIKNDNTIKKLYEQAGFEKTNFSYEIFIQNNFFDKPLFMYKLEMLFLEESNFIKKNFKENFFKSEIVKYLNEFTNEEIYKRQMTSLKDVFNDGFEAVINFDLFHD